MGYAAHSLKSAAKMLGFREISQITDGLEQITESITNGEIEHSKVLHDTIEKAVGYLKDLSEGKDVDNSNISAILNELEPSAVPFRWSGRSWKRTRRKSRTKNFLKIWSRFLLMRPGNLLKVSIMTTLNWKKCLKVR